MHELKMASQILESVISMAEENSASRIKSIYLDIGTVDFISDIKPDNLQESFDLISEGTIADGAKIEINEFDILSSKKGNLINGQKGQNDVEQFFPFGDTVTVKGILIEREDGYQQAA